MLRALIALVLGVLFCGCSVTAEEWMACECVCKDHGGCAVRRGLERTIGCHDGKAYRSGVGAFCFEQQQQLKQK